MNRTSVNCYSAVLKVSFITQRQLTVLTTANLTVMVGNVLSNALVVFILIKTKQIANITCKLIFMLSVSDLMVGLFGQTLFTTMFYVQNCLFAHASIFVLVFAVHLSIYTISIIGVDCYLRIKHYTSFKVIWTTKVVISLISIATIFALFQAVMTTIGLLSDQKLITETIYIAADSIILGMIIFLEILTVRTSNSIHKESQITTSERIDKKIAKLSLRIMFLLFFFLTPGPVLHILRSIIENKVKKLEKSVLEFFSVIGMIFIFGNSATNAVLFLMTNVKAKRFLRNIKM